MNITLRWLTPKMADIQEGKIIFDADDPIMAAWVSLGQYDPETVACFRSYLKEGMIVVDIGANLGYFTVIAARRVGPRGKVFSYEPDPRNFHLLEKNISVNGFRNVTAIPSAISDKIGSRELFFGDNNTTHSFSDKRATGRSESVATDTLDDSLSAQGSLKVDIIKMDIEGAEPLALEGMKKTIAYNSDLVVLFEFYPNAIQRLGHDPLGFLQRFRELGFSLSVLDEDGGTHSLIKDLVAFVTSFPKKDFSKNLIAVKSTPIHIS